MTTHHAKALGERLVPLYAERAARELRGVPVPPGLTDAIKTIEAQLANDYNRVEADNQDEAEFMKLQEPRTDEERWWLWWLVGGAVLLCLAAWIAP